MRVSTVLDNYFERHVSRLKTDTPRVTQIAINHLKKHFKGRHIGALSHEDFDAQERNSYTAVRARKVSEPTIRRELGVLIAASEFCVSRKIIPREQVPAVALPAASETKDVWLTRGPKGQAQRLMTEARKISERLYLYVAIGLLTGQRPSRVRYLTWDQIDFNAEIIDFRKSGATGNKKYGRVKIMPELMPILAEAYANRTSEHWVLGTTEAIDKPFKKACLAAGAPGAATPNTLRHTWATWAAQDGVKMFDIAGVLGNSIATVERKYAHHHPEYQGVATSRQVLS